MKKAKTTKYFLFKIRIACVASTVKWDDTKMEKMIKNNDQFVKTNNESYNRTGDGE
jgi:hypothetical protein